MAEILLGGKKLGELKVSELKAELEKRDLERKGIKSVLVTRLKNAILREALNQDDEVDQIVLDLDSSQAEGSCASTVSDVPPDQLLDGGSEDMELSEEDISQQQLSSSEDHEPVANTPNHELDPGHMSGAEEAPSSMNPVPAVVPSPDESAKEGNEESPQEEEEEAKEDDEVLVGISEKFGTALTERMDSVTIDPSFNPSGEELLYEGDMDAETTPMKLTAEKDNSSQDEGFIVNVHETSMELDMTESLSSHCKTNTTSTTTTISGSSGGGSGGGNSESKSSVHSSRHSADMGGTNSKVPPSSGKSVSSSSDRKKQESSSTPGKTVDRCSLWVSGLMPSVRALDLQTLFSPYAQVVSAKVVAKSRTKQLRFGFITVATPEEAQRCIKELNGTELKGKKITVELSKSQPPLHKIATGGTKSSPGTSTSSNSRDKSAVSDKKQTSSSSNSKTIIKRMEGSKTSTSSSGKSLADRIVERSRRSVEMRKVTTLTIKERENRRKSAPMTHRSRSHSRERISRLYGAQRHMVRPFSRSPPRPPLHGPGHVSVHSRLGAMPGNAEVMQRELAERDMFMRDRDRQVEMRRLERNREINVQRQLEAERSRREQDIAHHMQEIRQRELREREIRERQLIEQERLFKEKERELREREYRERQRREALERELREREVREHQMRERERRIKEAHDKELREREFRAMKEREMRERDTRMQIERERELRERERRLKEEQERVDRDRRVREEQQRWMREEAARAKAETLRLQKEREESDRRERERRQREEKEKRQEEELRLKRERDREREREREQKRVEMEKRMQGDGGGGRLGKRPYQDNGTHDAKRQAFSFDSYGGIPNSSSIFNRLDHKTGRSGVSHQMGGAGMGPPSSGIQPSDLPHVNPEIISAATQALENIRKSVPSISGNLPSSRGNASLQAQIQQLAAATALASSVSGRGVGVDYHGGGGGGMAPQAQQYPPNLMRQSMNVRGQGGGGGMGMLNKSSHIGGGMGAGGMGKLPPEDQRYNRRLGGNRSGGGGGYRGQPGRGPLGRQGGGY